MSDYMVVGVYCDGRTGHRHEVEPIRFYRRLVDKHDGSHVWAPIHSIPHASGNTAPLRDTRTVQGTGTHEEFKCRRCHRNARRRWDEVQQVLDAAAAVDRRELMLRDWQGRSTQH